MEKVIRDKTVNYTAYEGGSNFLGTTTVDLPEFSFLSDSIKGAGMLGETELPAFGQFSSMTATLNWSTIEPAAITLMESGRKMITLRSAQQALDKTSGTQRFEGVKIVLGGTVKTQSLGSLEVGAATGGSTELEITYIKMTIGGKDLIEVDKYNMIYKVNGKDQLADLRKALGE